MKRVRCLWVIGWLCLPLIALARTEAPPGVVLEPAQAQWLDEHRGLRVGLVLQAPYAQFDRRLQQFYGVNAELVGAIAQALRLDLSWRGFPDQAALEHALQAGEIDFAPGLTQTPASLRSWLFSDPYMRIPQLVVGARSGAVAVELEKLTADERVAVRMPSALADYLRSTYPHLNLQGVPDEREALQWVQGGQVSFAVMDEAQLSRLSRESEFAELAVVGDIGLPQLLRIGSRRDWPVLAEVLERALQAMPAKTLEQLHQRWLQPQYPRFSESAGFWQNLALLFGLLLLGALTTLVWQRRQQRGLERGLLAARESLVERQVREEALRLSQFSIDQSTIGILWVNWDSHIRYANHAAERMLGFDEGVLLERPLRDIDPTLNMDRWLELWKRARTGGGGEPPFENQCRRADGSLLPVELSLSFLRFRDAEYLVVFLVDVTERRRALAALRESEARLKGIAGNVPGLVFRLERDPAEGEPEFPYISEGSEALVGYSPAAIQHPQMGLRNLVHPEDRADYHRVQDLALASDRDWSWQGRILTRQGEQRWADIKATTRRLANGRMVWDGVVWDITQGKQAELALAGSQEQLRELSAHLESVREEEKARIAREVHDELGQMLTVLKLEVSMCELAYAELDAGLNERLGNMKRLIAQLFQLVRDVATALRPPILDAGIASAIEWQARRFEARTQIPCLVEVPEQLPPLSDAKATSLFRILQEALTNVMRHARAHTVQIALVQEPGRLRLTIVDDGVGFAVDAARPTSFGLVGVRERVLMLGGSVMLDSEPGEGTSLSVVIPLEQEAGS
ncbi:PAS domain S-box protein [Pseudomonas sp. GD03858]|uniref:PAS domain-containing sensor histidine kinase n=1 Tax=unclassified Pseudomonas TaxID=196821 RepID=UPI002448CF35|nr:MULTISPECIES: transporter substrate-binding domain-containing protein [unclassified Pseudomonas]MDH0645847.1 PAS domain S-box protein [Pseudomonas sp. GD03867]MDH0663356.1 PAS domain S-box protein [Pseudomonas sp. GD03858]